MSSINSVGKNNYSNFRDSISLARVVVPSDIDRDVFVSRCLISSKLSILSEQETPIHGVICPNNLLREIRFPKTYSEFGSIVLYAVDKSTNQNYIISVINDVDKISEIKENSYFVKKTSDGSSIIFSIDPDENLINININSKNQSRFILNLTNSDSTININSNGIINIESSKNTTIKSKNILLKTLTNEIVIDENSDEIHINSDIVKIGDGSESAILGDLFMDLFDSFIEELSNSTISTSTGQMPLLNKTKIDSFREKFKETLSKNVKIC